MAQVITSDDLGKDQTNQLGQQNQPGQSNSNANQAGQPPVQQSQGNASDGGATNNQPNNPNQQKGSGFTNIQKVMQANQGNNLGSSIGNNIQQVGSSAQNNLRNAQNQFQQGTQQNQFNTDANNQLVQNVLNDPNAAVNQTSGNQFQNLISGQYQGPQGLQNANELQGQASNVAQMGQALGTSGGRIGLLQQLVGNNGEYTAGQANLDNLLLGQSNSPELQAAKRQALTLQGKVGSAIQGAAAQGQQNTNSAQQFGQGVRDQFGNVVSSANSALQNQAVQAQQGRDAQYQQTLKDLQSGNINQDEANLLGLTQGQNVYNVLNGAGSGSSGANAFLAEDPLKANASNVASASDYAKMQALQKLGGQFAPQNASQAFQNYQDPSQASRFQNAQAVTGNQSDFQKALQGAQTSYSGIHDPAANSLSHAQQLQSIWDQFNQGKISSNEAQVLSQQAGLQGNANQNQAFSWNNLQSAQQGMQNAQNQLNSQFGTPETINITGNPTSINSSYPLINKAVSGNQQRPGDLEQFPVVS